MLHVNLLISFIEFEIIIYFIIYFGDELFINYQEFNENIFDFSNDLYFGRL